MDETRPQRRLAAILAADVVGYSHLMGLNETRTLATLKDHRANLFEPQLVKFRGRLIKLMGDGSLIEFASVVDAVGFAIDVQKTLQIQNETVPEDQRVSYRIGVNIGDVIIEGDDIYGDGVNVAARLQTQSPPGGMCISEAVYDQVKRKVEGNFLPLGPVSFKNLVEPIEVWCWTPMDEDVAKPPITRLALPSKPSIAVLPFASLSADPEQAYFVDGVTEDIVTGLSRCRWLFVIARNSTERYKGSSIGTDQIGRELGVRYLLEGSVRKSGNMVRVTSQLIDVESGAYLWGDRHDRKIEDIFHVQDEITKDVVGALEPNLKKAEFERIKRKRPEDLEAYDLYLRALQNMYDVRPEGRATALKLIEQALKIEPNYPEVHGLAAWCYFTKSLWEGSMPEPYIKAMLEHARAVKESQTDDASTLAHAAIAVALATRDFETALAMIDRAIEANPSSAHAHGHGSVINTWAGNADRSIELSERAIRLSPFDPIIVMPLAGQAGAWLIKGEYETAIKFAKRALQNHPTHSPSLLISIAALVRLDKPNDARRLADRLLEASPSYRIIPNAPLLKDYLPELRKAGLPE